VTVAVTVAVSVTVSFSVAVTVTVNNWLGAIGLMINGPSVDDGAADDATGGCAAGVVVEGEACGIDGEACGGTAAEEDGAGASDDFDEAEGRCGAAEEAGTDGATAEDAEADGAATEEGWVIGFDDAGELGAGSGGGDTSVFRADVAGGMPPVGAGAIVVYWVMMITGGGTRGVGARVLDEDIAGVAGCWLRAGVEPAASSEPAGGVAMGTGATAEDAITMDDEGYTVVYSVFVTNGTGEVELASSGLAVGRTLLGVGRVELAVGWTEPLGAINDDADWNAEERSAALELDTAPVGPALGEPTPGWLNPGRPVEFPAGALLGAIGVGVGSNALDPLSSGEYVKAGKLVLFMGAPTNAAGELAGAIEAWALDKGMVLLCDDDTNGAGCCEDGVILDAAAVEVDGAGAGVGVK
jgi:hypothetical protein